jgi:hypothetical protein
MKVSKYFHFSGILNFYQIQSRILVQVKNYLSGIINKIICGLEVLE